MEKHYFCPYQKCKYPRIYRGEERKGSRRKDNWRRHMRGKHHVTESDLRRLEREVES
jgi:hypothetical protein